MIKINKLSNFNFNVQTFIMRIKEDVKNHYWLSFVFIFAIYLFDDELLLLLEIFVGEAGGLRFYVLLTYFYIAYKSGIDFNNG